MTELTPKFQPVLQARALPMSLSKSGPASLPTLRLAMLGAMLLALVVALLPAQQVQAKELPDFTQLVKDNAGAVVNISTVQRSKNGSASPRGNSRELEEFFRRFFPPGSGQGPQSPQDPRGQSPFGGQPNTPARSLGSGFVISDDGYLLTNNHVIEGAEEILVRFSDRRELTAELIGSDPRSDLALLKVEAKNLPTVRLGKSRELEVGEWVLAIGSPFGFDYSVTAGIVSAKGRSLPTAQNENYVPFIQTDVAINPGNSGGPLFDLDGRVIGINSQIYSNSGGFMGVSFAIPIDVAMDVVEQLKADGRVSRGWLGVVIQEVSRDLAESFGLSRPQGALVARVMEDSPAERAGVKEGDVITSFNGSAIDLSSELPHLVGRVRAGGKAKLKVMRNGSSKTLTVKIGELADIGAQTAGRKDRGSELKATRLGLAVEDLPTKRQEQLSLNGGVVVTKVDGPAAEAGLRPGDVITRLNNKQVKGAKSFAEISADLPAGRSVPVLIVRGDVPTFLALRVPD